MHDKLVALRRNLLERSLVALANTDHLLDELLLGVVVGVVLARRTRRPTVTGGLRAATVYVWR